MKSPCQGTNKRVGTSETISTPVFVVQEKRFPSDEEGWWDSELVESTRTSGLPGLRRKVDAIAVAKSLRKIGYLLSLRIVERSAVTEFTDEVVWEERP